MQRMRIDVYSHKDRLGGGGNNAKHGRVRASPADLEVASLRLERYPLRQGSNTVWIVRKAFGRKIPTFPHGGGILIDWSTSLNT